MQREIERIVERILRFATNKTHVPKVVHYFKIDHLLFSLLYSNMELMEQLMSFEE